MPTFKNTKGESVVLFKHSIVKIKTTNSQTTIFFIDGTTEVFNYDELAVIQNVLPNLK